MNMHQQNVSMADLRATGNAILKALFLSQFETWLNPRTRAVTMNPVDTLAAEVTALPSLYLIFITHFFVCLLFSPTGTHIARDRLYV